MNAATRNETLKSAARQLRNFAASGITGFLAQAIDRLRACGVTVSARLAAGNRDEASWVALMIENGDVL